MATSSSVRLQGTVEQALVAATSQVAAAGTAHLRDAMAACQLDSYGATTPQPLPTLAAALPASLSMEDMPTPQAASKAAPPQLPPSYAGTPRHPSSLAVPRFAAQLAIGTRPPMRHT